jgi:general nucleoside transport system ATP-binding protein
MSDILTLNNITKQFGDVVANSNISLSIAKGEIHALLGENGAGKSTLMNILSGIYQADSGSIAINEQLVNIRSPKDAQQVGIGMIHQHFKLVERLSGLDNLLVGQVNGLWINRKQALQRYQQLITDYQLHIDLTKMTSEMSMGEKQILEILKVLVRNPQILIFDEPTTVLTPQEIDQLFTIMRQLRNKGYSLIFISHKMHEVLSISDRVSVLRKGTYVTTVTTKSTTAKQLTDLMVGYKVDLSINRLPRQHEEVLLSLDNVTVMDDESEVLKGISFDLLKGEILGVAGISGHGQKELCEAIIGMQPIKSGSIFFKGEDLTKVSIKAIIKKGIGMSFVPEDRLGMGLVASMNITDNILLKQYIKEGFWLDRTISHQKAQLIIEQLNVQYASYQQPISQLSGGNIQKVLVGRELDASPELLISAYPVRGLDIHTSHAIYDLINQQKAKGVGVIFIAEDLDALIALSDRVLVLNHGKVTALLDAANTSKEEVGFYMLSGNEGERYAHH